MKNPGGGAPATGLICSFLGSGASAQHAHRIGIECGDICDALREPAPPNFLARLSRRSNTMIRRFTVLLALAAALCVPGFAQEHEVLSRNKTATLMTGLGDWRHPVSTKNAQAQEFFDQGLRLIYAFNHDEAARSFQKATELDPKLAIAYWGIAEAVGPNYNDPASEDRFVQAHQAIEKAASLAEGASESDRSYIAALAKRFPADTKSDLRTALAEY